MSLFFASVALAFLCLATSFLTIWGFWLSSKGRGFLAFYAVAVTNFLGLMAVLLMVHTYLNHSAYLTILNAFVYAVFSGLPMAFQKKLLVWFEKRVEISR